MFNGSFLSVCRILWFVKKLEFAFMSLGGPSHGARVWCLGRVPKHRIQRQEVEGSGKKSRACYLAPKTLSLCIFWAFVPRVCFPYSSFQQVRQPSIPPRLKKVKSNFFTNRNILRTLKKEPLNIVLLNTSRTVWFLGRVPKHRNQWQEVEGLLFSPQNSQLVHILSFHS